MGLHLMTPKLSLEIATGLEMMETGHVSLYKTLTLYTNMDLIFEISIPKLLGDLTPKVYRKNMSSGIIYRFDVKKKSP